MRYTKNSYVRMYVSCMYVNVHVTAYGWQTIRDRSVVRSCDQLQILGATIISLERLNLKSSNFVHK